MKKIYFSGIIVILALSALFGCGGGGGGGDSAAQPTRADVSIAFDQAVTNLAGLDFRLNNTAGATFDNTNRPIAAINAAQGSLVEGNFEAATNSTRIVLANAGVNGFNTGTSPIIRITYAIAADAGRPSFSVDLTPATFTATSDTNGGPTTPAVTAANLVVTVTYTAE